MAGGYSCHCKTGFSETIENGIMSCHDINECAQNTDNCSENAVCSNSAGSFSCQCTPGYEGDGIICDDIDECNSDTTLCQENSKCQNFPGNYACICDSGFGGDGRLVQGCQDRDECQLRLAQCSENSECVNIEGGYVCKCDSGYKNHSGICVDVDECHTNVDTCHPMAECTNFEGGYECECLADWHGDGHFCSFDICTSCDSQTTCDGEECKCPKGYSGSGYECPATTSAVFPINSEPLINDETRECLDPYWIMISDTVNSAVILENMTSSWKPCMKMMLDKGVDVYLSISTNDRNSISKINYISKTYRGRFNGIFYEESSDLSDTDYAKELGLKIGLEMIRQFDIPQMQEADLIIIFKNNSQQFLENCGYYGQGKD